MKTSYTHQAWSLGFWVQIDTPEPRLPMPTNLQKQKKLSSTIKTNKTIKNVKWWTARVFSSPHGPQPARSSENGPLPSSLKLMLLWLPYTTFSRFLTGLLPTPPLSIAPAPACHHPSPNPVPGPQTFFFHPSSQLSNTSHLHSFNCEILQGEPFHLFSQTCVSN